MKGVELLGDNYTFYTDVPSLKDFSNTTFVFSVEVRSTIPGAHLQYYDGKNVVNSAPYSNKKGEWETLRIKFTVDAKAKFHRFFSPILVAVNSERAPSVEVHSIKLHRK